MRLTAPRGRTILAFLCLAQATPAADSPPEQADLLIRSATIIDVRDCTLIPDRSIVIRGREIVAVGPGDLGRRYTAAQTVDAAGLFAIPGLWDMHVHFGGGSELVAENQALLPPYVAHGVTAVRDAAADLAGHVLAWRRAIAEDALLGPTIFTSGPKLEGYRPSWKGTLAVGVGLRPRACHARVPGTRGPRDVRHADAEWQPDHRVPRSRRSQPRPVSRLHRAGAAGKLRMAGRARREGRRRRH